MTHIYTYRCEACIPTFSESPCYRIVAATSEPAVPEYCDINGQPARWEKTDFHEILLLAAAVSVLNKEEYCKDCEYRPPVWR